MTPGRVESSVQPPSQHSVEEEIKTIKFESLQVHARVEVKAAVGVLGLYAVLGPSHTCLGQCSTT